MAWRVLVTGARRLGDCAGMEPSSSAPRKGRGMSVPCTYDVLPQVYCQAGEREQQQLLRRQQRQVVKQRGAQVVRHDRQRENAAGARPSRQIGRLRASRQALIVHTANSVSACGKADEAGFGEHAEQRVVVVQRADRIELEALRAVGQDTAACDRRTGRSRRRTPGCPGTSSTTRRRTTCVGRPSARIRRPSLRAPGR